MINLVALLLGLLSAVSFYFITSKSHFRMLLGFLLLGQTVNLFLFFRGILSFGDSAFQPLDAGQKVSDPLIQALILTAIVISFAMISFGAALFLRIRSDQEESS